MALSSASPSHTHPTFRPPDPYYKDPKSNTAYYTTILTEARRVAARGPAGDASPLPIYAYTIMEYEDTSCPPWCPLPSPQEYQFLNASDFEAEVRSLLHPPLAAPPPPSHTAPSSTLPAFLIWQFHTSAKFGLAGLVLFGGAADGYSVDRCLTVRKHMNSTFLPGIKAIADERLSCAASRCAGHGRCVDIAGVDPHCACMGGWHGADCSTPS